MVRSPSSLLFGLILSLSFALVTWWTLFQWFASDALATASVHLAANAAEPAARALGADSVADLGELARRRRAMFASEGGFFALVLLGLGWLYVKSMQREQRLRATQDRFLAAATHELKTPLATVQLLLESLRDGRVVPDKLPRYLDTGLLEIERLGRGLDNVLTAAGLRSTQRTLHMQPGDLTADVQAAVAAVRGRALAAEVELHADAAGPLPCDRDPTAMQLILRNLLDNAIKYTPPGGRVDVRTSADRGSARIEVADSGRGMDQNELQHAFAPFWRGSDTASGGTGLGLHLVRQLVTEHGGTVQADSGGRDRGSVFQLRLPLRRNP